MPPAPPLLEAARALPASLAPDEVRDRVVRACARLAFPAEGGFEVRLAAGAEPVDLGVRLRRGGAEGAIADFLSVIAAAPLAAADQPGWRRLCAVLLEVANEPSAEAGRPDAGIWLEFDLRSEDATLPLPGVFFDALDPLLGSPLALGERLRGRPFPPEVAATVRRCHEAAGLTERVCFHGFLLGRPEDALRLHLVVESADALVRYARRIGWPGESRWLDREISALARHASRFAVNFDLGADVLPRAGVELFFDGADRGERLAALLGEWQATGLAAPEKAQDVLAWPATAWSSGDAGDVRVQVRSINHLKLTLHAGGQREAKAYLLVRGAGALPRYPGGGAVPPE